MLVFFCMSCVLVALMGFVFLNRIAYALYRPLCKKINAHIATVIAHRVFAIFSTYAHFRFIGDYSLVPTLPDQYLIISNHQSLLDIVVFMNYLDGKRLRFVAKKELADYVPLVSVMLKSDQHCLVQRSGSPSKAMQAVDSFAERVKKNNWLPVIFPEGTRSRTGAVGTFYSAGFRRFLSKAPMPVAVAALDGGWEIASFSQITTKLKGHTYRAKILKVYPYPATKEEQLNLLQEGKALIEAQLEAWRAEKKAL